MCSANDLYIMITMYNATMEVIWFSVKENKGQSSVKQILSAILIMYK